jgi:superfamily I DNA/RNA helicase
MPEFVAGLQFEVVYLIHVDARDAPTEMSVGERRRLISSVYLGASRAERELHLSCCENRGGPAAYLNLAIERQTLSR